MCGISGIISNEPLCESDRQALGGMNDALLHRGPDGKGQFMVSHAAIAMRRLSIIDLAGGAQPIFNEDKTLALVANGEIYNFVELRKQLESRGHRFSSGSDCETIVHLYEEYGVDCVQHLRGMFAFALWDERKRSLLIARDRMGEKPLYLYQDQGRLIFASEMKALLRSGIVPFELDPEAINLYFHYQYVPEPKTPLKGVRKLDAAHLLIVRIEPWDISERCYWRLEDAPLIESANPVEAIREELDTVSQLVVRSDVPVGVALSGGLDSSAVAALAARSYPGTMHAFSVGYPGRPLNDERSDAKALADHLEMPFHEVEISDEDVVGSFPELNFWRDDPIADIAGQGYFAVMKAAREEGVPVMLQGQGGDELFWGYQWVRDAVVRTRRRATLQQNWWRALPSYVDFKPFPGGISRGEVSGWLRGAGGLRSAVSQLHNDAFAPEDQIVFYDLVSDFRCAVRETSALYASTFVEHLREQNVAELFTIPRPWQNVDVSITRLICDTFLRENGITQGDRLSMASSIELRLPLIDYRLIEIVVGLRKAESDSDRGPKAWFREALAELLPDWVMQRPKRGFSPPVARWHRDLFAAHGSALEDGLLVQCGVLQPETASALSKGPYPPDAITPMSFKALVLEHWCRQFSSFADDKDHQTL